MLTRMPRSYVHGQHRREHRRLHDQAAALVDLLHGDTSYADGSRVLEAGCGVGAQTVTLARRSPGATFVSIDISPASLDAARRAVSRVRLNNVEFQQADILNLPFATASFDHVFVCFVLEHMSDPIGVLRRLTALLKPGGTITVIEGDHGSTYFHPDSAAAHAAVQCLVGLQANAGGNALIGRQLYPLLVRTGLSQVRVLPRMVYVDASKPDRVEGFTEKTFIAMIEGVRQPAIAAGLTTRQQFDAGIRDLRRATRRDGVFCYTFFKGVGVKRPSFLRQHAVRAACSPRRRTRGKRPRR